MRRLTYDEQRYLANTLGDDFLCPYARNLRIKDRTLVGKCSVTFKRCERTIPIDYKDCRHYKKIWKDEKRIE